MVAVAAPAPVGAALFGNASWAIAREATGTLVKVEGELDCASAGAIAAALAAAGADATDVTVDMADVDFIDLSGVEALIRVQRLFEILGLALRVRAPSAPVLQMLGASHLDHLICGQPV